jgi:hypothetical protein
VIEGIVTAEARAMSPGACGKFARRDGTIGVRPRDEKTTAKLSA